MFKTISFLAWVSTSICSATSTQGPEVGASFGTPGGVHLQLGYGFESPILVRARAGAFVWGSHKLHNYFTAGAGGELGWEFDRQGDFHQFVGLGVEGGMGDIAFIDYNAMGAGPRYGMRWNNWNLTAGFNVGYGHVNEFMGMRIESWDFGMLPSMQVGYSTNL